VQPVQPVRPGRTLVAPQPPATLRPSASSSNATTIRVAPGDSLWKLARRHFGQGSLWTQFLAANPSVTNPGHLHVGAVLVVPTLPAIASSSAAASGAAKRNGGNDGATIQVHKGDTLWTLAKSNLGRGAAWSCIAAANPAILNPDRILEGQSLLLPSSCGSAPRIPSPQSTN
jgi:nucleoid-associated protein YgaU